MSDSRVTIDDDRVVVTTGVLKTVFATTMKDAAKAVSLLHEVLERLKKELNGARKMACDLCSEDVPLRPDGFHVNADGREVWCDANLDEFDEKGAVT